MQFIAASIEQSELYPYLEQELSNKTLTIENWEQKEPEETKADYTTPPGDWTLIDVDSQLRLDGKLEGRELSTWQEFLAAPVDSHWYYTKEGFQGANVGTPVSRKVVHCIKVNGAQQAMDVQVRPFKSFNGIEGWEVRGVHRCYKEPGSPNYRFYKRVDFVKPLPFSRPVLKRMLTNADPPQYQSKTSVKQQRKKRQVPTSTDKTASMSRRETGG